MLHSKKKDIQWRYQEGIEEQRSGDTYEVYEPVKKKDQREKMKIVWSSDVKTTTTQEQASNFKKLQNQVSMMQKIGQGGGLRDNNNL